MKRIILLAINMLFLASCASQTQTAPTEIPTLIPTALPQPTEVDLESLPTEMVLIPAGAFTMGSDQETALSECEKYFSGCNRDEWYLNESPVHEVTLNDFYMDMYEVTNGQYQECVAAGNCTPPRRNSSATRSAYYDNPEFAEYPVIWVDWDQAQAYCEWRGARLPTEAEWEKAARGTDARLYPWGNTFESGEGNFCDTNCKEPWANKNFDDGYADTSPVGSFTSGVSPYRLHDMGGNVNEWVADWYGADYYATSLLVNPHGPETGFRRSMRGGSFHTPAQGLRTTARPLSDTSGDYIGFRCAVSVE